MSKSKILKFRCSEAMFDLVEQRARAAGQSTSQWLHRATELQLAAPDPEGPPPRGERTKGTAGGRGSASAPPPTLPLQRRQVTPRPKKATA